MSPASTLISIRKSNCLNRDICEEEVQEYIHPKFQVQEHFECIPTVQKPKEIVDVENIKLKSNDYNIKEVWNIHLNFVLDSAKKMWP